LVCGLGALVLSTFSLLPLVAWLTALLSFIYGLAVLLPRATASQKVFSGVGVASALVATGLLLT
jgi:hypothetical protein